MNTYSIVFLSLENPNNYNWFGQSYKTSLEHQKKKINFWPRASSNTLEQESSWSWKGYYRLSILHAL